MSILIKGMEMPKSCFYCPMRWKVDPDNIKCLATGEVFEETFTATIEMRNAGNCPLVPVPPHGRLGDLDKVYKDALTQVSLAFVSRNKEQAAMAVANVISNAPTIIPAEEGET